MICSENALEVYVNDPILDWLRGSVAKDDWTAAEKEKLIKEPKRRIANAILKVEGVHPVSLLLDDLGKYSFK